VKLRDDHRWDPYGHFSVLEWGSVDLFAYLEKYGLECSGVIDCLNEPTKEDSALYELLHNIRLAHGGVRERDFQFLYETVLSTYGNSLETALVILRGKYDLFPFLRRSARCLRDQQAQGPFDWSDVLEAAK
jgi:hypothetical protein